MGKILAFTEYEYIKRLVVENLEYYGVNKTPIDPFKFAHKIGISVLPYSSLEIKKRNIILKHCKDGVSLTFNGKYIIFYNDSIDNFKRIKQTIMHEIAHYLLGHKGINEDEEESASSNAYIHYKNGNFYEMRFYDENHYVKLGIAYHPEHKLSGHWKPILHAHDYSSNGNFRDRGKARFLTQEEIKKYKKFFKGVEL